jgi:hypothetical protein
MRYRSIGFAKTDWILILDSDEYISEELEGEIGDLFGRGLDAYSICMIEKKIQVKDQKVLYSFNYPNYLPRLFNTKTGARFKSGKIVHEQMSVPENLTPVRLKNCFWAQTSDNYRACVKKDVYQLGLMKRSTFSEASFKSRMHSFKMAIVYFLRAINIIRKALSVYIRFGYKHALPAGQVLRHVRVHLIISYWRFVQCIFGNKSHVYYEATSR